MNPASSQLNNFNMIFEKLKRIYRNNDTIIEIAKYLDMISYNDRNCYYVTILVNYSNGKNQPFLYKLEDFEDIGKAYDIYDNIRNKINYSIYKINY